MTTAAVDLLKLTQLEPPAPPPPAQGPDAAAPSFQEHLRQAERRSSDDRTPSADDRNDNSPHDATPSTPVESSNEHGRAADESSNTDHAASAADKKKPGTDDEKKHDHKPADEAVKQASHTEQNAPIAAVVPVAQPEQKPQAKDDKAVVVAANDVKEVKTIDKALTDASQQTAQNTAAATAANVVAGAVKPTTDKSANAKVDVKAKGAKETAHGEIDSKGRARAVTAVEDKAKQSESTKHGAEAKPNSTVKPGDADAAAKPTDQATPEKGSSHGREDAKQGARDPGQSPTANVPPADGPLPNVASTASTDVPAVVAAPVVDAKPTTDSTTNSKPDDVSSTTRVDRSHVGEPSQPVAHRDFGVGRTQTSENAASLSQGDRLRLVQRVARAVQTAEQRGGELKLRLSPPELGSLRLQVHLTDGALSARIETDNPAAKQVLIDNLPALRERLAEQNIRVEKFDVDLSNSGGGGTSQTPQQQQFNGSGERSQRTGLSRTTSGPTASTNDGVVERSTTSTVGDGSLNVIV